MIKLILALALLCDLSRLGVTPEQAQGIPVIVTTLHAAYTWVNLQVALFGAPRFVIRYRHH